MFLKIFIALTSIIGTLQPAPIAATQAAIFIKGPALSGTLVNSIGFEWMLFGIALLNFAYAPLMYFLRAPPTKEEKKSLIIGEKSSVRYVTYQNEEEDQ